MTYAVIELAGSQFLVSKGDKLKINRLPEKEGNKFSLVPLLVSGDEGVFVGTPLVEKAKVQLSVLEHKKDKKIAVRRFKSKSRYRKHKGHRQPVSIVEVEEIVTEGGKVITEKAEDYHGDGCLENLKLSTRTSNALKEVGITDISKLKKMTKDELLEIKGIGEKAVGEILESYGKN